ncbi:hypothetical protein DH2020_005433 [Rehmannia glutinosa]|uniref:AP2/ERF domain-containing protein n=1 Tax=Rehmannia glutinosa TaxID=99300 RepID=A0ABR0XG08_REHGL
MEYSPISNHSDNSYSSLEFPETTTSSSANSGGDNVVVLASARPKRRAGRKKFKETRHPVYRGVRMRNSNKWVCELREPSRQKRIWLGTYPTPEMAARAHDVAALALRGHTACLNFADSVWRLPIPASKDAKDLRKAAVEAAEAFRPRADAAGEDVVLRERRMEEVKPEPGLFPGLCDVLCEDLNVAALAEGVLMSPAPGLGWRFCWDEVESEAEVELWSF